MDADSDEDAAAMAQTMGFSSFGGPKKSHLKRRYDEFSFTAANPSAAGTGANAVVVQERNPSEISLEDDAAEPTIPTAETSPSRPSISQTAPPNLPARPAPGIGFVGSFSNRAATPQRSSNQSTLNPLWYEGYYDPSSNENPWHGLETSMGLKSLGPWPSRD